MLVNSAALPTNAAPEAKEQPAAAPAFQRALTQSRAAQQVSAVRTKLSAEQAAQALERAWERVIGEAPKAETTAILTAQWAHETGRGQAMMNFNFGGIKGTSPAGLSTAYKTREGWGKTEIRIVDRFRAYSTAEEGAADYVALLARRYPEAVEAARSGDPAEFVRALKERRYFTGNEQAYTRSVTSLSEAARTQGYEAIGGSSGALEVNYETMGPRNLGPRPSGLEPLGPAPFAHGLVDTQGFVAVQAIADEVSRAAFRAARERNG
jgi:flagellum-specific peptidoglycan hydrolase FlgJ